MAASVMIAGGVCLLEQPNCLGTSISSGFCTVWSRFLGFQNVSVDGHSRRHPWLCCDICLCCAEVTHILIHVSVINGRRARGRRGRRTVLPSIYISRADLTTNALRDISTLHGKVNQSEISPSSSELAPSGARWGLVGGLV